MSRLAIGVTIALSGWATLAAQDLPEWVLQLSRIKRQARTELERLPDFACGQTIQRFERRPHAVNFKPIDTLRLEVAYVGNKELYAPAGGGSFSEPDLAHLGAGGAMGTGPFSAVARNLLVYDHGRVTGHGSDRIQDRPALCFDFEIPEMFAGYSLSSGSRTGTAGLQGTFCADAETLTLLRIEEKAVDIPADLLIEEAFTAVDYSLTRIGASQVLLPKSAEMRINGYDGLIRRNVIEFSNCREYTAQSVIHFDDTPPASSPPPTPKKK